MVPIIQLEKLSSLTWLFALKSVTIGETVIKRFPYWLFAISFDGHGRRDFNDGNINGPMIYVLGFHVEITIWISICLLLFFF